MHLVLLGTHHPNEVRWPRARLVLANRHLNRRSTGSEISGAVAPLKTLSKSCAYIYSNKLSRSSFGGRWIISSFGWGLTILRMAARRQEYATGIIEPCAWCLTHHARRLMPGQSSRGQPGAAEDTQAQLLPCCVIIYFIFTLCWNCVKIVWNIQFFLCFFSIRRSRHTWEYSRPAVTGKRVWINKLACRLHAFCGAIKRHAAVRLAQNHSRSKQQVNLLTPKD